MKIKKGYVLRSVAGKNVVVSVGATDFSGMITLNESAAFMWRLLEKGISISELEEALAKEYEAESDVDRELIKKDVFEFCRKLGDAGLIDE
ncbi:MAG: PqqD family protein [Ruminococcaceae bacterium]|nr:PqqD family protein [Oscillospiraceae bacterium]